MSNTVAEFQSAPMPATTLATNDEKDLAFDGTHDVVVRSGTSEYESDELEPTEEEFATLRK